MTTRDISDEERRKKIAKALLKGWRMLSETCPICGTPLFQKPGGEIICPICETRVILVSSEEEGRLERTRLILSEVMDELVRGLEREMIGFREGNVSNLDIINKILDALAKLVKINNELKSQGSQE